MKFRKSVQEFTNVKYITENFSEDRPVNEGRTSAPRGGFSKSDIEKILKKSKDLELFANGQTYYILPHMHKRGSLDDADEQSLFAVDQDGEEHEIQFSDIEFIEF